MILNNMLNFHPTDLDDQPLSIFKTLQKFQELYWLTTIFHVLN